MCSFCILKFVYIPTVFYLAVSWLNEHAVPVISLLFSKCCDRLCVQYPYIIMTQLRVDDIYSDSSAWSRTHDLVPYLLYCALFNLLINFSLRNDNKPCKDLIISVSGFENEERTIIKLMLQLVGAQYTGYFSKHNNLLVCKK